MKNLKVNLAVIALLAGSALAIGSNAVANPNAKPFTVDGYFRVNQSSPPAKMGSTNLGTNAAAVKSIHCPNASTQCAAEFNTDGSLISGTLITGSFQ